MLFSLHAQRRLAWAVSRLLALLVISLQAKAQHGPTPILNPRTVTSPSGEFTLHIDPSDHYGGGQAAYRLKRKDRIVWEGTRPFTLWEASVTEDGTVGGYAYSYGPTGSKRPNYKDCGDFEIVILDPMGRIRLDQKTKRRNSNFMHASPVPLAAGLVVNASSDRLIVRVGNADLNQTGETWWVYQLSTGRELQRVAPSLVMERASGIYRILTARAIVGTPLTLVRSTRYDPKPPGIPGARFTLIDTQGKPVWNLELPHDYAVAGGVDARDELLEELTMQEARQRPDPPRKFTVRFVAQKQHVAFAVTPKGSGKWRVLETGRKRYVPPVRPQVRFDVPALSLALRDQIELKVPGASSPPAIRSVYELVSAEKSQFAFLRRDIKTDLVVVDAQGAALYTVPLDRLLQSREDAVSKLLWWNGTRFLVCVERRYIHPTPTCTEAFVVEARTGGITPLQGFRSPPITSLALAPNGGFVIVTSFQKQVSAFDARGRHLWTLRPPVGFSPKDGPEVLFSPEAATVLRSGLVAVLDVIRHTVQSYDPQGRYVRTISLDRSWQRKASYPCEIFADPQGGFLVRDSGGKPSLVWMDAAGKVVRSFMPRYPSGGIIDHLSLAIAPDGNLWVTDTNSLLRLGTDGLADARLGEAPNANKLGVIREVVVFPDGRILAADERTEAVHVFDTQGRWLHVCNPNVSGHEQTARFRSGEIELGPADAFAAKGRWFGADGKRQEAPVGFAPLRERLRRVSRRPDGTWLDESNYGVAAPDGAFAILDEGPDRVGVKMCKNLSLYSASGTPERLISLPAFMERYDRMAYDGKQIVLANNGRLYCYGRDGKPRWQFTLRLKEAADLLWTPFLTDAGKTLCLFDGKRTLYRYALP
jgi:sugar lactone lactonase YvrE